MRTALERFTAKVVRVPESTCWLWDARVRPDGYGHFWMGGPQLAHRAGYRLLVGPIPAGLDLDHLCRVRSCVNPEHLEPVTRRTNIRRSPIAPAAINARRERCSHGHPFDATNTYVTREGKRQCRRCNNARRTARYWEGRATA